MRRRTPLSRSLTGYYRLNRDLKEEIFNHKLIKTD